MSTFSPMSPKLLHSISPPQPCLRGVLIKCRFEPLTSHQASNSWTNSNGPLPTPHTNNPYSHQHIPYIQCSTPTQPICLTPIYHTRAALQQWLHQARCTTPPPLPPPRHHQSSPLIQQTVDSPSLTNNPWGDDFTHEPPPSTIHILSCNANSLSPDDDFLAWHATAQALQDHSIHVTCLQGMNLQWIPPILSHVHQIFYMLPSKQAKIATSIALKLPSKIISLAVPAWSSWDGVLLMKKHQFWPIWNRLLIVYWIGRPWQLENSNYHWLLIMLTNYMSGITHIPWPTVSDPAKQGQLMTQPMTAIYWCHYCPNYPMATTMEGSTFLYGCKQATMLLTPCLLKTLVGLCLRLIYLTYTT